MNKKEQSNWIIEQKKLMHLAYGTKHFHDFSTVISPMIIHPNIRVIDDSQR